MHPQLIEPPSSRTILEKSRVKAAYLDFWNHIQNNPSLLPVYSPDIVEDLFDRASEIVARIRILLNKQNPSAQILRNSCGLSKEKLWHRQLTEKQITSPEEFVRDLVHTSLQDVQGKYINGLTSEKVDEYIKSVEEFLDQNRSKQGKEIVAQFKSDAEDLVTLLQGLDVDDHPWKDYSLFLNLKKIASEGASLKSKLKALIAAKNQPPPQQTETKEQQPDKEKDTVQDKSENQAENEKAEGEKVEDKETPQQETSTQTEKDKESETTPTPESAPESTPQSSPEENKADNTPVDSPLLDNTQSPASDSGSEDGSHTPTTTRKKYEIKINQVADDVSLLRGKVQHLSEVAEKLDLAELAKDPKEGSKAINDLQKKCLQYTENLMKNLLSLDEIIGSTSTRSQKKQQINTIQDLMADMDSVNERLKKFSQTLKAEQAEAEKENQKKHQEEEEKKKLQQQEEKASKQSSPTPQEKSPVAENEDVEDEEEDEETPRRIPESVWRSLKLNPSLDVREFHDRYIIAGQLPGVRRQDLNVDLSPNKTLVISGVRLPTEKEEALMRKHAQTAWARNHLLRQRTPVLSRQEEDRLVLEMANGRYGSFSETYRLPGNVDKNRIAASLEKGILQVTIPKIRSPRPAGPFYDDYYW